jgi:AcrR family transcriptional regulator
VQAIRTQSDILSRPGPAYFEIGTLIKSSNHFASTTFATTMHSALTSAAMASARTPPETPAVEPPPKSQPRVRLEVDARRAQLLEIGRELFTTRSYDELSVDEIAQAAGISKGLLYHYFPGKRVFYIESLREAAEELLRQTMPPRALAPIERLRAGIDAYLT